MEGYASASRRGWGLKFIDLKAFLKVFLLNKAEGFMDFRRCLKENLAVKTVSRRNEGGFVKLKSIFTNVKQAECQKGA